MLLEVEKKSKSTILDTYDFNRRILVLIAIRFSSKTKELFFPRHEILMYRLLQNYHRTKKGRHCFHIQKLFSSDTHQNMKMSDGDLKVNRNIFPYAVNAIGCV